MIPEQFSDARQRLQHVGIINDVKDNKYPLLLSKSPNIDAGARDKIKTYIDKLENADNDAEASMRKILLFDTLLHEPEVDYIDLQQNSWEVSLFGNGSAYEHGATFALALIIGYLITAVTQIYKDKDRFLQRDFDERIELCKLKLKLQQQQDQRTARVEIVEPAAVPGAPTNMNNLNKSREREVLDSL